MAKVFEKDARDHLCPYNGFAPCFGAKCMAWVWIGPDAERCTTTNLQQTPDGERPVGDPPAPNGDGWDRDGVARQTGYHRSKQDGLPPAISQGWIRRLGVFEGRCGRSSSDEYYGGF